MAKLTFKLNTIVRNKQKRKYAVAGLQIDRDCLAAPQLLGAPYYPPLVFIVPGFSHAVFNLTVRRTISEFVEFTSESIDVTIASRRETYVAESANLSYSLLDDNGRTTEFIDGTAYFSDQIVRKLTQHYSASNECIANHACGIIHWDHLTANGYTEPLHDQNGQSAVILRSK